MCSARSLTTWPFVLIVTALFTLNCAGTAPTAEPEDDDPDSADGPAYTLLVHTDARIALHTLASDDHTTLLNDVNRIKQYVESPAHDAVAFTYTSADSVHLARYNASDNDLQQVDAREAPATYSVAWHATANAFAYGVYTPTNDGDRGAGTIRIAENGDTRSVQCSASTEVLAWLPDNELSVRDNENMYIVDADDCSTLATLDIRRHHHLTYNTAATHLAYIYRTLEYDRSANEYAPDSSLYVSAPTGSNETLLFGNDRAPRHAAWAPQRLELAASVEEDGKRRIVLYDTESDETTFLIPPASGVDGAQQHPHWAPGGDALAFTLHTDNSLQAAVHQAGSTERLGHATGAPWGWVDDQTLIIPTDEGLQLTNLNGSAIYTMNGTKTLVGAWPIHIGL